MDVDRVFDEALQDLRVSGAVLLHDTYAAPFAIEIPEEAELKALISAPAIARVMPFHLVCRGGFDLKHPDRVDTHIGAGHVAICPSGARHEMHIGRGARPISLVTLLRGDRPPVSTDASGGTELVCGVFRLCTAPLNPLLAALPAMIAVAVDATSARPTLSRAADLLVMEVQAGRRGSFVALRLIEILCAEAIRAFAFEASAGELNWFRGLRDQRISPAIVAIHRAPSAAWTVARLADLVAMSPSRFAVRFREAVGESVLGYVTRWRMTIACRMLGDTPVSLAQIASDVGYSDLSAFARAFKSLIGTSPAQWRKARADRIRPS